ncbi:MAG: two-component regulator propeller domain-containing protein [Caldilineaceae bacterium]
MQRDLVDAVTVVGDLDALWVSSGFGVSVLTETGAFFYDRNNSPLETNQINVMRSDAKGTVWLGTRDKVYAVNGENWTIYSPAYVLASRFPTGEITDLAIGRDGALWIGSDAGELCKFDVAAVTCDPFFAPEELGTQGGITALALDNLGRLYVATANDGVRFYDEVGWRSFILPSQLNGNQIRALTQDVAGYLWVMSEAGLQQLDPQDTTRTLLFTDLNTDYPIATVATLFADPEQGIWVGGQDAGYFTGATWTTFGLIDGLIDRRVRAVVVDEQQRTWIGTENGLSIWNGDSFFNLTGADGLPGETVTALLADGEAVWIGTNNGLLRFAENRLQIFTTATTQLPSNQITALAIDEDHALWIGTTHGLVRFLGKTMSPMSEFENQAVVALAVLAGNAIWVTTEQMGLQYFNGLRWTTLPR